MAQAIFVLETFVENKWIPGPSQTVDKTVSLGGELPPPFSRLEIQNQRIRIGLTGKKQVTFNGQGPFTEVSDFFLNPNDSATVYHCCPVHRVTVKNSP
jgi:hypothetical protein